MLQKTNERIWLYYYDTSSRLVFVRFLEEIEDTKKYFEIIWPLGRYFRYPARKAGLFKILHHITELQHCMRLKIVLHNSSHTRATYKDIKAFSMATHLFLGLECLCAHGIASNTFKIWISILAFLLKLGKSKSLYLFQKTNKRICPRGLKLVKSKNLRQFTKLKSLISI